MALNHIDISGRLVRDPEIRQTNNGKTVASLTVACDRNFGGDDRQTDFVPCTAWGKTAEFVGKYFHKGDMIIVSGSLQSRQYEKDGEKRTAWEVLAEQIHFCGGKGSGNDTANTKTSAFKPVEDDEDSLPF